MKKVYIFLFSIVIVMTGCSTSDNRSSNASQTSATSYLENTSDDFEYVHNNENTGIIITSYNGGTSIIEFPAEFDGLKTVMIGKDTISPLSAVFADAALINKVEEITIPDSVMFLTDIDGYAELKKVNIPKDAQLVYSISNCPKLEKLSFSDNTSILGTFENDISLTECNLPSNLGEINDCMFRSCSKIEKINLPESVTQIGQCAFYNCISLKEINIPDSVGFIAKSAFVGCDDLVVSCNSGSYAQEYCNKNGIKTNIIGKASINSEFIEKNHDQMDNGEIRYYYYNDDFSELCVIKYYGESDEISINEYYDTDFEDNVSVTGIGQYFIEDNKKHTVYIPEAIIRIDDYAFAYPQNITIKGEPGSYAEEYAKKHNIAFVESK